MGTESGWRFVQSDPGVGWIEFSPEHRALIIRQEPRGEGFTEALLGWQAVQGLLEAESEWASFGEETAGLIRGVRDSLRRSNRGALTDGGLRVVFHREPRNGSTLPLFLLFTTHTGKGLLLRSNPILPQDEIWLRETQYALEITSDEFDATAHDYFADTIRPGGDLEAFRHSTALRRLRTRGTIQVAERPKPCDSCRRCAYDCAEMFIRETPEGVFVLSTEQGCTGCLVCTLICPFNRELSRLLLPPEQVQPLGAAYQGGGVLYLAAEAARAYVGQLEAVLGTRDEAEWRPGLRLRRLASGPSLWSGSPPTLDPDGAPRWMVSHYEIASDGDGRPLLVTVLAGNGSLTVIQRQRVEGVVYLTTPDGMVELEMGAEAQRLGVFVRAVADPTALLSRDNRAVRGFQTRGLFTEGERLEDSLIGLDGTRRTTFDLLLTAEEERVPQAIQETLFKAAGGPFHLLSPGLMQSYYPTQDPLLVDLRDALVRIYFRYSWLMALEQREAARYREELLTGNPHAAAFAHARFRTYALAQGGTPCAGCPEFQGQGGPIHAAILSSLARGEVPQITVTLETGCMSETLLKAQPASQSGGVAFKWPGGRTLFGGGFAFGEGVALAQELAVKHGHLPRGRRYVVSLGGDGGATIGLPELLNALRQKAFQIPVEPPTTLHWIQITDTQGYSNTGGEASVSLPIGTGSKTTPMGELLLGMQHLQTNLINLAAEFPGILVGMGHSGNRQSIDRFWLRADALGLSAVRWDFTPCVETFEIPRGTDGNDLARYWAFAGLAPEVEFVGRLRKRIAPVSPLDNGKGWREWTTPPKPLIDLLRQDLRFRDYFVGGDQVSGELVDDPIAQLQLAQLARYRDSLNWWIDLESRIAWEAEELTERFFLTLAEEWRRQRDRPEGYKYRHLYDDRGILTPEYGEGLKREFAEAIIGADYLRSFSGLREDLDAQLRPTLEAFFQTVSEVRALAAEIARLRTRGESVEEIVPRYAEALERLSQSYVEAQGEFRRYLEEEEPRARDEVTSLEPFEALRRAAMDPPAETPETPRRIFFESVLDRLLADRALARLGLLESLAREKALTRLFVGQGGLVREESLIKEATGGARFRALLGQLGGLVAGVGSISGDRGITINRILVALALRKGAWAEMFPKFKSSKRGELTESGALLSGTPILRKDWLTQIPHLIRSFPSYEEVKDSSEIFLENFHPLGVFVVNTAADPEAVRDYLIALHPPALQRLVRETRSRSGSLEEHRARISQALYGASSGDLERRAALTAQEAGQVNRVATLALASIITAHLDRALTEVGLDPRSDPSNLAATGLLYHALRYFGLPFDLDEDRPLLREIYREVVRDGPRVEQYLQATLLAHRAARGVPPVEGFPRQGEPDPGHYLEGPAGHVPMANGGTALAIALSQIASEGQPVLYFGFPITPSGDVFSTLASLAAKGHPWIWRVDENVPSEKVNIEKMLGAAKTGLVTVLNATASQGYLLYAEGVPFAVGARLPMVIVVTGRSKSAPWLNIEESQADFLTFSRDGALILLPKSIQEAIYAVYLAHLLAQSLRLPVIVVEGGITDTHRQALVRIPTDEAVREHFRRIFEGYDPRHGMLLNRQGEVLVVGASAPNQTYLEIQATIEAAHKAVRRVFPYLVDAVEELTGYRFDPLEVYPATARGNLRTALILMGSRAPTAEVAVDQLREEGFTELGILRPRLFSFTPDRELASILEEARTETVLVLDMANDFGRVGPLAKEVEGLHSRYLRDPAIKGRLRIRSLIGGVGGREITVGELKEELLFTHLLLGEPAEDELAFIREGGLREPTIGLLLDELAAQELRSTDRQSFVPSRLRGDAERQAELLRIRKELEALLALKEYIPLLSTYGRVEFLGVREQWEMSRLARNLVIRLEILLATSLLPTLDLQNANHRRRALRYALLFLQWSREPSAHSLAGETLARLIQGEDLQVAWQAYRIVRGTQRYRQRLGAIAETIGRPGGPEPAERQSFEMWPRPVPDAPPRSPAIPSVEWTPIEWRADEAERLRMTIQALLKEPRPFPAHPYEVEWEAYHRLASDPDSLLFGRDPDSSPYRQVIQEYSLTYAKEIPSLVAKTMLPRDFAPELDHLFSGTGRQRLSHLIRVAVAQRRGTSDPTPQAVEKEIRTFLDTHLLPEVERDPAVVRKPRSFYRGYYNLAISQDLLAEIETTIAGEAEETALLKEPAATLLEAPLEEPGKSMGQSLLPLVRALARGVDGGAAPEGARKAVLAWFDTPSGRRFLDEIGKDRDRRVGHLVQEARLHLLSLLNRYYELPGGIDLGRLVEKVLEESGGSPVASVRRRLRERLHSSGLLAQIALFEPIPLDATRWIRLFLGYEGVRSGLAPSPLPPPAQEARIVSLTDLALLVRWASHHGGEASLLHLLADRVEPSLLSPDELPTALALLLRQEKLSHDPELAHLIREVEEEKRIVSLADLQLLVIHEVRAGGPPPSAQQLLNDLRERGFPITPDGRITVVSPADQTEYETTPCPLMVDRLDELTGNLDQDLMGDPARFDAVLRSALFELRKELELFWASHPLPQRGAGLRILKAAVVLELACLAPENLAEGRVDEGALLQRILQRARSSKSLLVFPKKPYAGKGLGEYGFKSKEALEGTALAELGPSLRSLSRVLREGQLKSLQDLVLLARYLAGSQVVGALRGEGVEEEGMEAEPEEGVPGDLIDPVTMGERIRRDFDCTPLFQPLQRVRLEAFIPKAIGIDSLLEDMSATPPGNLEEALREFTRFVYLHLVATSERVRRRRAGAHLERLGGLIAQLRQSPIDENEAITLLEREREELEQRFEIAPPRLPLSGEADLLLLISYLLPDREDLSLEAGRQILQGLHSLTADLLPHPEPIRVQGVEELLALVKQFVSQHADREPGEMRERVLAELTRYHIPPEVLGAETLDGLILRTLLPPPRGDEAEVEKTRSLIYDILVEHTFLNCGECNTPDCASYATALATGRLDHRKNRCQPGEGRWMTYRGKRMTVMEAIVQILKETKLVVQPESLPDRIKDEEAAPVLASLDPRRGLGRIAREQLLKELAGGGHEHRL